MLWKAAWSERLSPVKYAKRWLHFLQDASKLCFPVWCAFIGLAALPLEQLCVLIGRRGAACQRAVHKVVAPHRLHLGCICSVTD